MCCHIDSKTPQELEALSPQEQQTYYLLRAISFIKWMSLPSFFISFMLPVYAASINVSGLILGITVASDTFGNGLPGLFIGKYINIRGNIPRIIRIGTIIKSIAHITVWLGFGFKLIWLVAIGMFLEGVGRSFVLTSFDTLIADYCEYDKRSEYYGKMQRSIGIGVTYGCWIGFTILPTFANWPQYENNLFLLTSSMPLFAILAWISVIRVPIFVKKLQSVVISESTQVINSDNDNDNEDDKDKDDNINDDSKNKRLGIKNDADDNDDDGSMNNMIIKGFILVLILLGIEALVESLVSPFVLLYLSKKITDDTSLLSLAYAPGGLLSVMFAPYLGRCIDRCSANTNTSANTSTSLIVNANTTHDHDQGSSQEILRVVDAEKEAEKEKQKEKDKEQEKEKQKMQTNDSACCLNIRLKPRYILCILSIIGSLVTLGFVYSRNIIQVTFVILVDFTVVRTAGLTLSKIISTVSKDKRGTVFGIRMFVEESCNMIGPIIGGILWDYVAIQAPFWTSIFVELVVAVLYVVFFTWVPIDTIQNNV